ncbi:cupin-like domain-containing protein [Sphingomonas sabuli]|uniref:Cupin-like domain-containing protein n=1 Tax=Sphingomonas sabuli TaxID=2764186 RepID=A0A7G9KZA8_9SPHN|nr:cupin-like domain-containing protein [Sphingomonas sabuli]QNM81707.1 cupin-like domain-containing protein [Sphingomonas sabuli]
MAEAAAIFDRLPPVAEEGVVATDLAQRIEQADRPFVMRGIAADWPLVRAGLDSGQVARDYLVARARDRKFPVNIGQPGAGERLFYNAEMGMNFQMANGPLDAILGGISANEDKPDAPLIYLGSIDMGDYFEGLREANTLPLGERKAIESIWIGTRTRIAAHNDMPNNVAVCAVGRRRFTIFPPDQFANLYPGPIDNTPAGRPVSMVDLHAPDFEKFPRFRDALETAQVAMLEPGDAVFIPSMWWHHVEGLSPFNILVNFWFSDAPSYLGKPEDALNHAILAIRDLPPSQKEVLKAMFDFYVFGDTDGSAAHIPEGARGIHGTLTPENAGRIRAHLLRALSQ